MKEEYFAIFSKCFPEMKIPYKRFCELLHKDTCTYFEIKEDNEICAFAIIEDFQFDKLTLHGSDIAEYGWFNGDMDEIKSAVALVDESWIQYFVNPRNIYVAKVHGEIASFCLVDTNCQNYLSDKYCKVGMPGCVGTVPKFRNKGIALEMVARVTEYLKKQGMEVSFIFFTGVAEWYEKIGYKTFLSECFGVKKIVGEKK